MKCLLFFALLISLLVGCKDHNSFQNKSILPELSTRQLKFSKQANFEISLPDDLIIDDLTPVYYDEKENILYVFDAFKKRLFTYSFLRKRFLKIIDVTKQLPLAFTATGMTFCNSDTIILYDYHKKKLALLNTNGLVFDTLSLKLVNKPNTKIWNPSPLITNHAPAFLYGDSLNFLGFVAGENENESFDTRNLKIAYSLAKAGVTYSIPYTKEYERRNYGGFLYRIPYGTFNKDNKTYLISLPAAHEIIEVNLSNKVTRAINMSANFVINIPPLSASKAQSGFDKRIASKHYSTHFSYKNIIYDPYKNIYIRILENPLSKDSLNSDMLGYKKCSALIYDSTYRFIQTFDLDKYLSTDNFFVTPEGICFLRGNNKNENIAQYAYYKIQ